MRRASILPLSLILAIAVSLVPAGSAIATTSGQPDLIVKGKGDDVISDTGEDQVVRVRVRAGRRTSFPIVIDNDGATQQVMVLQGSGDRSPFTVKYINVTGGGTNATDNVTNGTWDTAPMDPQEHWKLKMILRAKAGANRGTSRVFTLDVNASGFPDVKDVVQVKAIVR